ncbi:MAG TPA: IclR family transcriptional regulator [Acidobacteriaceae bacterium]|nr:IclR family transcriptional regulator [Acidobacteriaceae bacterium]
MSTMPRIESPDQPVRPDRRNYRLQSVDRALAILELLGESDHPLSLGEISERMRAPRSTVHRALIVLERGMLLERTPDQAFQLGMRLYNLGLRAVEQMDLRVRIRPFFERLSNSLGETVHLGMLRQTSVVYLDKVGPAGKRVCRNSRTGSSNPAHCTAMGKAMLAWLPTPQLNEVIDQIKFVPLTENSICSREELIQSLDRIRRRGYSIDNEEAEAGARCIGAPIFNANNEVVAALSVSCMAARIQPHQVPVLAERLVKCCAEISASLRMDGKLRTHAITPYGPLPSLHN